MRSTDVASRQPEKTAFGKPSSRVIDLAKPFAWPLIFIAIAFAVYYPSLKFGFILDDHRFTADSRIQESGHISDYFSNFVWAQFTGGPPSFYRPVFLLWMRLNYLISELSPFGWHLLSIFKHALVAIVLALLIFRLLKDRLAAFATATVFMLHPSNTESVSWTTVPDPLLTLCLLLSLLLYVRYLDSFPQATTLTRKLKKGVKAERTGPSQKWLLASASAYLAALFVKETAIIFPAVILVFALSTNDESESQGGRGSSERGAKSRPIAVQAALFGSVTVLYLLLRWNALDGKLASATQHLPAKTVLLSWPITLWFYVKVILWPFKSYSFADPALIDTFSVRGVIGPLLALILCAGLIAAVSAWVWKRSHQLPEHDSARLRLALLSGILLFILPLLLALNLNALNPGDFLHGRYVYLPLSGLMLLLATIIHLTAKARPVLLGIAGALAIAFVPLTWAQEKQWQDDTTVFTTAHQLAPHNLPVAKNLENTRVRAALLIADEGRCDEAAPVFEEAIRTYPDDWYAWAGRGICLVHSNDLTKAEEAFHRAADLSHDPGVTQQWQALRAHMGLPTSAPSN
jgi:protein O-mannosyl-transferase